MAKFAENIRVWLLAVALLVLVVPVAGQSDVSPSQFPAHIIVGLENGDNATVARERQGFAYDEPITLGMLVSANDLIEPSGGVVTILCGDGTYRQVSFTADNSGCDENLSVDEAVIVWAGIRLYDLVRANEDEQVAYVISPRNTLITTGEPTIRWTAVEGATGYQVTLRSPSTDIWDVETNGTVLFYPNDEDPLPPGEYGVGVVPMTGNNVMDSSGDVAHKFCVVDDTNSPIEFEFAPKPANVEDRTIAYAEALVLKNGRFYGEAIERLNQTISQDFLLNPTPGNIPTEPLYRSPRPYILLGHIYAEIGLTNQAASAFEAAAILAERNGQIVEMSDAYNGLAIVEGDESYKQVLTEYVLELRTLVGEVAPPLVSAEQNIELICPS